MAQVILGGVGGAVGGALGATIGGILGRSLDQGIVAALEPARQRGPRIDALKLQGTAEGAPMACVFGRARVTGQVIWAARFLEERRTSSGGKGGPRSVEYGYSLSFAVALCEGEIDGIGRVWADGELLDLSRATMRIHRGGAEQVADPLILAVEGEAPAYRDTAYVVFEDLPLGGFGNRIPQLSFEVFRRPRGEAPALEDRLEGVCLIPGAGEFTLAAEPVVRREGLTRTVAENVHAASGRSDLTVSLDQLQTACPNLKRVNLVIGWFGDDLRASKCKMRPGVDRAQKHTEPIEWSVAGLRRDEAHQISQVGGVAAYGGTPSDSSVRQAVRELKRRGLEVTLYPFVFMDIPPANGLPDPWGGDQQAAYPWRGRIRGRDGAFATSDVEALFGAADGWGLRRLALHYAAIAAETGADGLLIGSEMRGLTFTRDAMDGFPAVTAYQALAAECRAVVGPEIRLSYAADWSEYAGVRSGDDVFFHLDSLWADVNIDHVSIDWYPPMGDWRNGDGGLDAEMFEGPDDPAYLANHLAGGEGFHWFYATETDRDAQVRSPIVDDAHGEDWVFRVKDLEAWWANAHHDRPGGLRSAVATAWVPRMKPIRLTEFGCAAVDRGGNAPNLFQDPKSSESALPPGSTGARDDRMQRRALEAVLTWTAGLGASAGQKVVEAADAWCWDARPWPAFPGLDHVWTDGPAWSTGHWLNGRLGGETRDLIAAILRRGGLEDFDVGSFAGEVAGYVIDGPMRTRDALEPLLRSLGLVAAERGGQVAVIGQVPPAAMLSGEQLALPDEGHGVRAERTLEFAPTMARVRFIDGDAEYRTGSAVARTSGQAGGIDIDVPAVCTLGFARAAAERTLRLTNSKQLTISLGPLDALRLEPGDTVMVDGQQGVWRITRIDLDEGPAAVLEPQVDVAIDSSGQVVASEPGGARAAPFFRVVELPPLPGFETDARPLLAVAADPWRPMGVWAGPLPGALTRRAEITDPATVGVLTSSLGAGPRHRWDETNVLEVRLEGRSPQSRPIAAVLAGANLLAVESAAGWELVQFRQAVLGPGGVWRLSGLLRGQQGTRASVADPGAIVVMIDGPLPRADGPLAERETPLIWRAGAADHPAGGVITELSYRIDGVHGRPWSPAHLRFRNVADGGLDLSWIPRSRLDGDRWDRETKGPESTFRIRVLNGEAEVRRWEVEGTAAVYLASDIAVDFPSGSEGGVIRVAQWGESYGWGDEAEMQLD